MKKDVLIHVRGLQMMDPEEEQERDRRNMAIASYKGNKEAEYLLLML